MGTLEILEDFRKKKLEGLLGFLMVKKGLCTCFRYFQIKGKNPSNPQVYSPADRQHYTVALKTSTQVKGKVELYLPLTTTS